MGIARCNSTNVHATHNRLACDDADVAVISRVNWLARDHLQIRPRNCTRGSPTRIRASRASVWIWAGTLVHRQDSICIIQHYIIDSSREGERRRMIVPSDNFSKCERKWRYRKLWPLNNNGPEWNNQRSWSRFLRIKWKTISKCFVSWLGEPKTAKSHQSFIRSKTFLFCFAAVQVLRSSGISIANVVRFARFSRYFNTRNA